MKTLRFLQRRKDPQMSLWSPARPGPARPGPVPPDQQDSTLTGTEFCLKNTRGDLNAVQLNLKPHVQNLRLKKLPENAVQDVARAHL
ncbi:hypothetical protein OJAV_G00072450 [Oryzias javanicus]|uniref:Uncharacterized protein n=1 Tax=Oryzias javanicus TaxID=123683 RepID=A0A3S2Q5Z6_ORYJA|nr:hypothetical protein OJAV_G00072450 [Oryzias javanicus]